MFELELYETEDGKEPVVEFLDSLEPKMNAKLIGLMELLEEKGTELRELYSAPLGDGIFELRCKLGSNITRSLYFFFAGKRIVVTNGFVKKTNKTPPGEIKLAKERRQDWIRRHESDPAVSRRAKKR
ncbi:MAG: type II toxin-antitoxin system RelE/ParE family toxin [Parasporobacterium sp.]|nr:type II toxin-antitoxin system RelE/ParE family toxin [Parasporobacterium sp.]